MAMLATLRSSRRAVAHLASSASLSVRPASSLAAVEADSRPGGGGFFANLFAGGGGPGGVPMTEPLPGAPVVVPAAAPAAPPATQSSSLPNGATIAAEDTPVRGIGADLGAAHIGWSVGAASLAWPGRVGRGEGRPGYPWRARVPRVAARRRRPAALVPALPSHTPSPTPTPPSVQGPTTTLGIYVDSGSVYETPEFTGELDLKGEA